MLLLSLQECELRVSRMSGFQEKPEICILCKTIWYLNVAKQLKGNQNTLQTDLLPAKQNSCCEQDVPKLPIFDLWSMQTFLQLYSEGDSRVLKFLGLNSRVEQVQKWEQTCILIVRPLAGVGGSHCPLSSPGMGWDKQGRPNKLCLLAFDPGRGQIPSRLSPVAPPNHPKNHSKKDSWALEAGAHPSYSWIASRVCQESDRPGSRSWLGS